MRKILEDTAKETQAYVYETAAKDEDELLGKLKQRGMQVERRRQGRVRQREQARSTRSSARKCQGAKEVIDRAVALGK